MIKDISQIISVAEYNQRIKDKMIQISLLSFNTVEVKFTPKKYPYFKVINLCNLPGRIVYNPTTKKFVINPTFNPKAGTKKWRARQIVVTIKFLKEVCKMLNHYLIHIPANRKRNAKLKRHLNIKPVVKVNGKACFLHIGKKKRTVDLRNGWSCIGSAKINLETEPIPTK